MTVVKLCSEDSQLKQAQEYAYTVYNNVSSIYNSVAIIDLMRVEQNYKAMSRLVGSRVSCGATVKSNAYGLGVEKIGLRLMQIGCTDLFVIDLDEAITLRALGKQLGIKPNIFLYNGVLPGWEQALYEHDLTPALISYEQILRWHDFAKKMGKKLPTAIHFDTGMLRTGLSPIEAELLFANMGLLKQFELQLVMSHLACHSVEDHPMNQRQLNWFKSITQRFPGVRASLANTASVFLGPEYHFDVVRPGVGLYDISDNIPSYEESITQPVLRIGAKVIQLREASPGDTVSYNCRYQVTRPMRLATVAMGYADGIMRSCSQNQSYAMIWEYKAPIVGVISMDLIVLDVTDVPENLLYVGQWAEFLNDTIHFRDYATAGNTISREIMVRLGRRGHRHYKTSASFIGDV